MKVGIHSPPQGLGLRVQRVLAAEPAVFTAAVSTHEGATWNVIVTDSDPIPNEIWAAAEKFQARLVARARPSDDGHPGLFGCDLRGVAEALAAREAERSGASPQSVAWTVEGDQLRSGEVVEFPDPLGRRLGRPVGHHQGSQLLEVPIHGPWGGVAVSAEGRTTGLADDRLFVEAIALAAGTMLDGWPGERITPGAVAEPYLEAAVRAGLGVARLES